MVWDHNIMQESYEKRLATKAISDSLTKAEENRLIECLKLDPTLAIEWGLVPDSIPHLLDTCIELTYRIYYGLNSNPAIEE